jgi:6-pyruvoyltetrahydropterin/6-carboxytetrahydropterin synthase
MFELNVITRFAAAHQLTMVGEKCENLHGHNWKIEVRVRGEALDEAGVLIDFGAVKKHVREIMNTLDHKFLNELPVFENRQPSSERIAVYVAEQMQQRLLPDGVRVASVTAWESEDASATYVADAS